MGILNHRNTRSEHRIYILSLATLLMVVVLMLTSGCNSNILLNSIERKVEEVTAPKNPKIVIQMGSSIIEADNTLSFGYNEIRNTASIQFSIKNEGTAPLRLTGDELVAVTPTNSTPEGIFSALQPSSPIQDGGSVNFYIDFTPALKISYSGKVTIESNDPELPVLTFNINGIGTDDVTSPTILSKTPGAFEPDHPVGEPITVSFNEPINASSLTESSFAVTDITTGQPVNGMRSFKDTNNEAIFTPSSNLTTGHEYEIDLTIDIVDLSDNALDSNYNWRFTVKELDTMTSDISAELSGLDLDSGNVTVYLLVYDHNNGTPIENLGKYNFFVEEQTDGEWDQVAYDDVTIQNMGASGKPKLLTFVIDNSASVGGYGLGKEKTVIKNILDSTYFTDKDSGSVWSISPIVYNQDFTQDITVLKNAIDGIYVYGMGLAFDCMYEVLDYYMNAGLNNDGMRAAFLNFDGDASAVHKSFAIANMSSDTNTLIFPLGFSSQTLNHCEILATSGTYYYTPEPFDTANVSAYETAYQDMLDHMNKAYVLTWSSLGSSGDSVDLRITVEYSGQNGNWSSEDIDDYTLP
jgi:hypothetical protein